MTDRLKAWCHWKRLEKDVDEDTLIMVRDIEAILNVVAEAKIVAHYATNPLIGMQRLQMALAKLEAVE